MVEDDHVYLRAIEARFLELAGRGYALSARDVGRVLQWRAGGVPLRVALGVIEERMPVARAEANGKHGRLSLVQFQGAVDDAARRWVTRVREDAPSAEPALALDGFEVMARALGDAASDRVQLVLQEATRALDEARAAGRDAWETAELLDATIIQRLEALLAPDERLALRQRLEGALDGRLSARARAEALDFELAEHLRAHFAVPHLARRLVQANQVIG